MAEAATTSRGTAPAAQFVLSDEEFYEFQTRILDQAGIALGESKRALVTTRVSRRLRRLGLSSFRDYLDLLAHGDADGKERIEFVNAITTNKTDFFREPHHFAFLRDTVLPEVLERTPRGEPLRLRLWSAACSTGQEPYTLAMTVAEASSDWQRADVRILASDIDTNVLRTAAAGTYDADRLEQIPAALRERWFRLAADGSGTVVPMLRDWVVFRQINFMDVPWPIRTHFDAILCRNVAIYFARDTQRWLFESLAAHLAPGGYLMVGHSENLGMMSDLFELVGTTTYRRRQAGSRAVTRRAPDHSTRPDGKSPHRTAAIATRRAAKRPEVRIGIGGVHASAEPIVIRTVLGSCISACLYDPVARLGGMNHFMLPEGVSEDGLATRFGVHAMELLVNRLLQLGADRRRLRAKVFGGANVMPGLTVHVVRVAEHNVAFVKQFLETDGIPIVAQRLGGRAALQVLFEPDCGRVLVRALTKSEIGHLPEDEEHYRVEIVREVMETRSGGVTLF